MLAGIVCCIEFIAAWLQRVLLDDLQWCDTETLAWLHYLLRFDPQARLAQLSPPARELAGVAATIGRAFTFPVLARASDADEPTLVRWLDELWQRRIVREQGQEAYDFNSRAG